ncbi:MAG: hypothetical protein AUI95_03340 [Crenarchaeota archaeon 13_1_40CM_3_52_4]|nr:MAG: hypothetical protein AUI95_03340 [Crenarchaeota archaeon 13_1_40CM_3_52_4]
MTSSSKIVRKQTITTATLENAWKAWTSVEGVTSFFVPKANVESVVSGRYELFSSLKAPKGFQGTEGCKVLALEPQKHLYLWGGCEGRSCKVGPRSLWIPGG